MSWPHFVCCLSVHTYPDPQDMPPVPNQFAEIGEFGGLGSYISGKQWIEGSCFSYEHSGTPEMLAHRYIGMLQFVQLHKNHISAVVYTQITDVELECDGFLNYDRSNKFDNATLATIKQTIIQLINS